MNEERKIIAHLSKILGAAPPTVRVGIGDDAAVVQSPTENLVFTVDSLVEGVHFDLRYTRPEDAGHKALAVNLSDMAAMGAKPLYALVSLALPQTFFKSFIDGFYSGLMALADRFGVAVIGGNLAKSPGPIFCDVTLVGEVPEGKALLRSGARPGDAVGLLGQLGAAAAGLELLRQGRQSVGREFETLCQAQLRPEPLVDAGQRLRGLATSLIDISDGLVSELTHLATRSSVGIEIGQEKIPILPELQAAASRLGKSPLEWLLNGGEDYALLFTFPVTETKAISDSFWQRFLRFRFGGLAAPW